MVWIAKKEFLSKEFLKTLSNHGFVFVQKLLKKMSKRAQQLKQLRALRTKGNTRLTEYNVSITIMQLVR